MIAEARVRTSIQVTGYGFRALTTSQVCRVSEFPRYNPDAQRSVFVDLPFGTT